MQKELMFPFKNREGSTKRALLASILSMILCLAMVLGTTMAWFTAQTANRGNMIAAGTMGVSLNMHNGTEYQEIDGNAGGIFSADTQWEPGRTELVLLKVQSEGTLALDYNIKFVLANKGEQAIKEDVFTYAIVPGMDVDTYSTSGIQSWEGIRTAGLDVELGTFPALEPNQDGETTASYLGEIEEANGEDYFALAVHMSEDAGNDYQACMLAVDVEIYAKQKSHEDDSFGNQYDAEALWVEELDLGDEVANWNALLAAEEAYSQYEPVSNFRYPITPNENLITNGDFSAGLSNWQDFSSSKPTKGELVTGYTAGNGQALKLSSTTGTGTNLYWKTFIPVTEEDWGDEYQLSYYYRMGGSKKARTENYALIEFFNQDKSDVVRKEDGSAEQCIIGPRKLCQNNETWYQEYGTFVVPEGTYYIEVVPRVANPNTDTWSEYDEFVLYKTNEGGSSALPYGSDGRFTIQSQGTIFYSDMESTEVSIQIEDAYKNTYKDGKVTFELWDSARFWKAENVVFNGDGAAITTLNLAELKGLNTPYCLKAIIYDKDGNEVAVLTKELFMFERPAYLSEDGKFTKFGEDFTPIVGYHVKSYDMAKAAQEGGVNVVQLGYRKSAEEVLAQLDECAKNGVKGIACLYYNMKPAAFSENLKYTIDIVSDPRIQNHEALYGYCTMDEAFLHIKDPNEARKMLIDSYRLIRQYDKDNLIFAMECYVDKYAETVELADAFFIDPYYYAEGANVYSSVDKALDVVNKTAVKKPVWALLQAFDTGDKERIIDADGARNNNWQALIAGADMIGYFAISDAGKTPDPAGMPDGNTAMWEMSFKDDLEAGAKLWAGLCEFNEKEKEIAFDHFVRNEGTTLSKDVNIAGGYISYSWADKDGKVYVILLNVKGESVTVNVDLENADSSAMGDFTATVIAGRSEGEILTYSGNKTLSVELTGVEAVLFEVQ